MAIEPVWRKCDECDVPYIIVAVLNPRRHRWAPLPLSLAPEGYRGNFDVNWNSEPVEVFAGDKISLGRHPVATYGAGEYLPHRPAHFIDDVHDAIKRRRLHNFVLAMDDDEDD
jgi:hypothetical protein